MAPANSVFCLDASACALLSEDFGGTTRWHFQRELVCCHTGAAARHPSADVAIVASSGGRASVALHPTHDATALQAALRELAPAGEANLEASIKLALLVSRRFPAGSTHITAFVSSSGAAAGLAAQHPAAAEALRQRVADAGLSLDVAVLCSREELGAGAVGALEALTSCRRDDGGEEADSAAAPCRAASSRLLWLTPIETAEEMWLQLEPALEQLEAGSSGRRGASSPPAVRRDGSSSPSALPRHISRAPRQFDPLRHPRTSLLASRSGVQQPALCRGESLSRLGHLSSDGMARPWLPTYSSLSQQAAAGARAGAVAAVASTADMCYVEVQPLPRWRTRLKVAAGRMLSTSAERGSSPRSGSGYAAASSDILQQLETLSVLDEQPAASSDGAAASSEPEPAPAPAPSTAGPRVRFQPDGARGVLRLLQGTKEPHLLKLVWSAQRASDSTGAQQQPSLDMFGDADGSGGGGGRSAAHLSHMPAATAAASAARGPLIREGCELWEAAAEFDWELLLTDSSPAAEPGSSGGAGTASALASARLLASFEARELPNGAQLLIVLPSGSTSRGFASVRQRFNQRGKAAVAFWLQQHVVPQSLELPAYATAVPAAGAAEEPADSSSSQEPQEAAPAGEGPAALLAAAVLCHLRQPPAVDLRRLRKDVKSGDLKVTPITVGPLPVQFVRDIVHTRSQIMAGQGVENLDSWGDDSVAAEPAQASSDSSASNSGAAAAAGGSTQGLTPEAAAAAMSKQKSAVLSLLRQRLGRLGSGKDGGSSSAVADAPAQAPQAPATAAADPAPTGECDGVPCSTPQPVPAPAATSSYSSSAAGSPYGTPFAIVPTRLLRRPGETPADCDAPAEHTTEAGGDGEPAGLPGQPSELLEPKREGSVLVGAASGQGEPGEAEHMFQFE